MFYIFEKESRRVLVQCPMETIPQRTKHLEKLGWTRIWTIPGQINIPTYQEAYEESEAMMLEAERGEGPMVSHMEEQFSPEEVRAELRQYA